MTVSPPDAAPLRYVEFAPGAAVDDLALTYWGVTVQETPWAGFEHVVWPDGCIVIALSLLDGEPVSTPLIGPRRTSFGLPVQPGMQYWGVRFRPEMGASFLGRPARLLRDQVGPAHFWMGAEPLRMLTLRVTGALAGFPPLSDGLEVQAVVGLALDRWLFDSADTTMPPDQAVRDAVRAIVATEGGQQIATIATIAEVSPRHLQRCFKDAVGLSPKEYALLRRDRRELRLGSVGDVDGEAFAGSALQLGYADAGHLSQDVTRLMHGASEEFRMRLATILRG